MPRLSRLFIKTSLVYLAAALLVSVAIAAGPLLGAATAALTPTYLHLFVVGWLTELIFGVAFWLFPRHSRDRPYGRVGYAWSSYVLLNAGLLLRAAAEPGSHWQGGASWGWGLGLSAVLQWAATLLFAGYIWNRVKIK